MTDDTFASWMKAVDQKVEAKTGCSVYDLPDCCFADWHESGMTSAAAANGAIRAAKDED